MEAEKKEFLINEVIGYLRAKEEVEISKHLQMFKTGMYYVSGRDADLPVSEAIDIVRSAVDYVLDHPDELEEE